MNKYILKKIGFIKQLIMFEFIVYVFICGTPTFLVSEKLARIQLIIGRSKQILIFFQ